MISPSDAVRRLDPFFAGWKVSEIDVDAIRKFQRDQQAKGLSNASINRSVSALRRMFNLAVDDEKLRYSPSFKKKMLKESKPRQGFFDRAEYARLSAELPDYLRLPLALGFFTGMRDGEVKNLGWKQVDLLANEITLYAGETKNDEGRTIPIVPELRAMLLAQRARRHTACPYVCFRLDRKGRAVKLGSFRKAWDSACVRAGLGKMVEVDGETTRVDRPNARPKQKMKYVGRIFHDLRRSAVRSLDRAHVSRKVAMKIVGHKTESIYARYNIVDDADVKRAGRQLAAYLDENGHSSGTIDRSGGGREGVVD